MSKERATPVDRRLVAMQERIEELERTCQDHGEIQAALCKQIDALQADNERLREALDIIAGTDPLEAALDPQRAVRVARNVLAKVRKP